MLMAQFEIPPDLQVGEMMMDWISLCNANGG
jgi:hypothetical protein